MYAIELQDISKHFKRQAKGRDETFCALDIESLKVRKGEFLGIIGPNGAGKSTLLRIISGIIKPTRGHVKINGSLISFIELGVGFNDDLTGYENALLYGSLLGLSRGEILRNISSIKQFSGIKEFFDSRIRTYSAGMKIRLAFSIAALCRPDILVMDEILAVGDEEFQEKSIAHISNLNIGGTTVVLVSHDLGKIKKLCSRVLVIAEGREYYTGDPEKAVLKYLEHLNRKKELSKEILIKDIEQIKKEKASLVFEKRPSFLSTLIGKKHADALSIAEKETKLKRFIEDQLEVSRAGLRELNLDEGTPPDGHLEKKAGMIREIIFFLETGNRLGRPEIAFQEDIRPYIRELISIYEKQLLLDSIKSKNTGDTEKLKRVAVLDRSIRQLHQKLDRTFRKKIEDSPSAGFGTKVAIITDIILFSRDKKSNAFFTGQPFKAEIYYDAREKVIKPMFGIAIHSSEGVLVTGPNTTFSGFGIQSIEGKGKITFSVKSLPLLKGKYFFSASIYDYLGETPIDHHYKEKDFEVIDHNTNEIYGFTHMGHSWSHEEL